MGSVNYAQAIKPDTAYIKKIIENSLLADWAIRIEYHSSDTATPDWQLWGKTFFALRTAETVILALLDCYKKHPNCTIRLNAEKFRPQSQMLYTVYNPEYLPARDSSFQPSTNKRKNPYHETLQGVIRVNTGT